MHKRILEYRNETQKNLKSGENKILNNIKYVESLQKDIQYLKKEKEILI